MNVTDECGARDTTKGRDVPLRVRNAASVHGFIAFCAGAICVLIIPAALFVHTAMYVFITALITAITCILIRIGLLRAMRLSFWAVLAIEIPGVLALLCAVATESLRSHTFSIDMLIVPIPIAALAILSLLNLLSRDARSWFFDSSNTTPTST